MTHHIALQVREVSLTSVQAMHTGTRPARSSLACRTIGGLRSVWSRIRPGVRPKQRSQWVRIKKSLWRLRSAKGIHEPLDVVLVNDSTVLYVSLRLVHRIIDMGQEPLPAACGHGICSDPDNDRQRKRASIDTRSIPRIRCAILLAP
jgi:hypothetical protein